jgi:hypothetical protein
MFGMTYDVSPTQDDPRRAETGGSGEPPPPRWIGAAAAFYLAAAYLGGMAYFLLAIDYPSVSEPLDKITLFTDHLLGLQLAYLGIYVVFGVLLAVLAWTLHGRLRRAAPHTMRVATSLAIVWAGVLIAGGMVMNLGMERVVALQPHDPPGALYVWLAVETVTAGITGGDGELLGGLWTLLVSVVAWRSRTLPRAVVVVGALAGAAGVLSAVPGLTGLVAVFGLAQLAWFVAIGVVLARAPVVRPGRVS